MRTASLLLVALLCATAVAGCSNPIKRVDGAAAGEADVPDLQLPEPFDLAKGRDVGAVPAPAWRPGYHFTYTEAGGHDVRASGTAFKLDHATSELVAWGPRQGLNYTVVNVDGSPLSEASYVALHMDDPRGADDRPRLLAFDPHDLAPLAAGLGQMCSSMTNCTSYVIAEDPEGAPILSFPLRDGPGKRGEAERSTAPWIPVGPIDVVTRVLGLKEVEGPFGVVQAVHVHQDFGINITSILNDATPDPQQGITALALNGTVHAMRDVFYAPSLLNIVLDQSVSEGDLLQTYQDHGVNVSYHQAWRSWQTQRLTGATYDVRPAMPLQEIDARLDSPVPYGGTLYIELDQESANVADGGSVGIQVKELGQRAADVRIDVWSPTGGRVSTAHGRSHSFTPTTVDAYLVTASAYDADGRLVDRAYSILAATYFDDVVVDCAAAVDAASSCPAVELPFAMHLQSLAVMAQATDPVGSVIPLAVPARLAIDTGDGQEISSDAQSGTAWVQVQDPVMMQPWQARYRPDAAVAMSVALHVSAWPSWWIPWDVYHEAANAP